TVSSDTAARSAPNLIRATHPREAGAPYTELWASLTSAQSHVEVYVGDPGDTGTVAQTVTLEGYGAAPGTGGEGTPLVTSQVTVTPGEPVDALLAVDDTTASIRAIHITDFGAGGHIALDDLAVGSADGSPPPAAPAPVTGPAIQISDSVATLTGTVDAKGQPATFHFDYVSAADGT